MHNLSKLKSLYFAPIILLVFAGCGGGGGGGSTPVTPVEINQAPVLTVLAPATSPYSLNASTSQTMDIRVKAADPNGGNLQLDATWDGGSVTPAEGTIAAGSEMTLKFTAPNTNKTCKVTLSLSDGEKMDTKIVTINVNGIVQPPPVTDKLEITGIALSANKILPNGTTTATATISNPGGKTLTYKWSSLSGKFVESKNSATWTAPAQAGIYGIYLTISDGTQTVKSGMPVTVSGSDGGLLGQYFKTIRDRNVVILKTLAFQRVDPQINLNWWELSPDTSKLPNDGFGARWTGLVKCEAPGTYVFRVHVDDGARMNIMDDTGKWVSVIPNKDNNWGDHIQGAWLPATTVPVQLQGGKWYPIELEYFEGGSNAFISLYWSINGGPEQIVPQSALKPPAP